jgi:glycosyltransferase involved in cell wall biosynthesis
LRTESYLICTGTIGPLKNSLSLARLAREAQVPVLFLGKPFDYESAYWKEFERLIDNNIVKHHQHIGTEAGLIEQFRKARGYVLMSRFENWSLAAHEAAACGLPLLVPDQPWSRERFGEQATYFPKSASNGSAAALRAFYEKAPDLPSPNLRLYSWREVAEQLRQVYARVLAER